MRTFREICERDEDVGKLMRSGTAGMVILVRLMNEEYEPTPDELEAVADAQGSFALGYRLIAERMRAS